MADGVLFVERGSDQPRPGQSYAKQYNTCCVTPYVVVSA